MNEPIRIIYLRHKASGKLAIGVGENNKEAWAGLSVSAGRGNFPPDAFLEFLTGYIPLIEELWQLKPEHMNGLDCEDALWQVKCH